MNECAFLDVMVPPSPMMKNKSNGVRGSSDMKQITDALGQNPDVLTKALDRLHDNDMSIQQLLATQAELIAEQQKSMVQNDAEIRRLKEENETLKRRLERSDRRSAVCTNNPSSPSKESSTSRRQSVPTYPPTQTPPKSKASRSAHSEDSKKAVKRKTCNEILETETDVRVYDGQPQQDNSLFQPSIDEFFNSLDYTKPIDVQVPIWRMSKGWTAQPLRSGDEVECLGDETFMRRHSKYENEEKRLIRRDRIRQREELLRRRLLESSDPPATDDSSIHAIKFVKICSSISTGRVKKTSVSSSSRPT